MKPSIVIHLTLLLALAANARAQQPDGTAIEQASRVLVKKLDDSLAELASLRERVAAEKLPMGQELRVQEQAMLDARREFQERSRLLETRALSLSNLEDEIQWRREDASHIANLLSEYMRNFESRIHVCEMDRYRAVLDQAKSAMENTNLSQQEVFASQVSVVAAALDRLDEAAGGTRFEGGALDARGIVTPGTFVLVGPNAVFLAKNGSAVGTVEQRLESNEPSVQAYPLPEHAAAATALARGEGAVMPMDPSLGEALRMAAIKETFWEHVKNGGPVMYPIFLLAGAALLVGLYKWLQLSLVRNASQRSIDALLDSVARGDRDGAQQEVEAIVGPTGRMLAAGVEHIDEPRELIEEVMYEHVLAERLQTQRLLPFVAITASSAPLLGLLGTVTGIMNTFALMTVFGTGNSKQLSSGISEALITTEWGLYVAIPALLLHAFLSRKAKGVVDGMEKAAVAFANQVARVAEKRVSEPAERRSVAANAVATSADHVRDAIAELIAPVLKRKQDDRTRNTAS